MARQFEGEMGSLELFNDSIALAENEAKNDKGGGVTCQRVGSETKYPNGADEYLNWISEMVPDIAFGHSTRVVFDVDCGVANFGAYLNTTVQFALECGVPAMLAVFATSRLLYPSQAFDFIPCTRCQINKEGYIAMWRKPVNNTCYASHGAGVQPPICDSDDDPENLCWCEGMRHRSTELPENDYGSNNATWPACLHDPPDRPQSLQQLWMIYNVTAGCEPFDTYTRTYDQLHATGLFSVEWKRDSVSLMDELPQIATATRWVPGEGPHSSWKDLICGKRLGQLSSLIGIKPTPKGHRPIAHQGKLLQYTNN
ncbi:hypothetical protein CUMW_139150 [Citrus unshiu]|uniref:Methyltransferase n=1 Tax=Citrus unshiu TaxID=55188 RepID=A0A2H5PI97_CITUN|nr:hypothetical protein CUMW_139150 [Citrus unshiu]